MAKTLSDILNNLIDDVPKGRWYKLKIPKSEISNLQTINPTAACGRVGGCAVVMKIETELGMVETEITEAGEIEMEFFDLDDKDRWPKGHLKHNPQ